MVSIIITSYNYGKYIERAIRSCLDQTLDNSEYEIIIVNDCSTDFTEKILENYKSEARVFNLKKKYRTFCSKKFWYKTIYRTVCSFFRC